MRRVPTLRGLQAFDAVAQTGNLAEAADRLGITASAVSHRLRGLEDELGAQLVRRGPRGLALTETGRRYHGPVADAFALLASATADLLGPDLSRPLTVSLTSSIGVRWLMPRFHRFRALHPEMEISLLSTGQVVNLQTGEVDLAIRYGTGDWPGLVAEPVLRFAVSPLCSPRLLPEIDGLSPAEALRRNTLIHCVIDEWNAWLEAAGIGGLKPARELRFADYSMAAAAAVDGAGFILGYTGFVDAEMAAGTLVRPFDLTLPVHKTYHLVYLEERLRDPRVRAFRDWVISERDNAAIQQAESADR